MIIKKSDLKVVANGHILEVYNFENGCYSGFESQGGRRGKGDDKSERENENRTKSSRSARNRVRRQVLANFNEHSKFITLTFKDNVTDVQIANKEFKKFIQRMRRRYSSFKYLAVIEFQERGAVHYHMMSDLPYIPNKQLNEIWRNGFVRINDIKHVDNVGAYMVKYMLKDVNDDRLKGNKAYLSSRGLDKEKVFRGEEAKRIIELYGLEGKEKVFTNSYESEHHGQINYSEYNLKR